MAAQGGQIMEKGNVRTYCGNAEGKKNFLVVDSKVHIKDIEEQFHDLTARKDISMILITQDCAEMIRRAVDEFAHSGQMIPTVLEIPSKDTPYDPRKDGVMQRVAFFMPSAMASLGASAGVREIFSALSNSEARYFDEERYSESELRKALNDSITERKIDAMKRLLAAVSVGRDASALFPDVVKNVSFQSPELKKLIYIYLVQYAENNRELALLSINSFQKDLSDRSQQLRASALRAMASIKVLEVIQLVMAAVQTAVGDSSPYVRKTAAQCMIKVYGVDADQFLELRKLLLKLMNDVEVQVVGSAVMAFRQICIVLPKDAAEDKQGSETTESSWNAQQLELLHPLFKRLVQDMLLMDFWAQQCCIDLLMRYCRLFFASPDKMSQEGEEDFRLSRKGVCQAHRQTEQWPPMATQLLY
eukprot:s2022_g5.t2